MANKSAWITPLLRTQGTQTEEDIETTTEAIRGETMMLDQNTQTEIKNETKTILLPVPIPIPIYVPLPMATFKVPCPTPVPLPIPVPVLLPVKPEKQHSCSHPFEEEVLKLAEALDTSTGTGEATFLSESSAGFVTPENSAVYHDAAEENIVDPDMASVVSTERVSGEHQLMKNYLENHSLKRPASCLETTNKKRRIDNSETSQTIAEAAKEAWSFWALWKEKQTGQAVRPLQLMSADEMCSSLVAFVNESEKANGEKYQPDALLSFLYGLQDLLFQEKRVEVIFSDAKFQPLQTVISKILRPEVDRIVHQLTMGNPFSVTTCISEADLWNCKQLGSHTPAVLVFTLMYFNTKYFKLYTVEQHMQLGLPYVQKVYIKNSGTDGTKTACLRYIHPSVKGIHISFPIPREHEELAWKLAIPSTGFSNADFLMFSGGSGWTASSRKKMLDQPENMLVPEHCPVRLFSFYLKKCLQSLRPRTDVFYLMPESSCSADSPVWYTSQPIPRETLEAMLQRILFVTDIVKIFGAS